MSLRWNGSVMGKASSASIVTAGGMWSLRRLESFVRQEQWPFYVTSPSNLTGLVLWLDGNDGLFDATSGGSAVTVAGNAVARWEDKSTNALHYTQGTANNRPLLVSGGGLDFDGTNDQLQSTNGSNALFGKTVFSAFILFDADSYSGDPNLLRFDTATTNDHIFELGQQGSQNLTYVGRSASVGTFRTYPTSGNIALATGTKYLYNFIRTSDTAGSLRINNSAYTNFTGSLSALNVRQNQTGTLGAFANNLYFNGKIYEVIMYDRALPHDERVAVQNYLNKKWSYI